jgi:ATP phosphoribosyltransferase regulatory subunit
VIGGGRYDHLLAEIGAGGAIPAVGFAVWLDRIAGGAA